MHVGGVRTALFAWLWARKNNGTFILRIEDTDKEREVEGSIAHIMESLKWIGIGWDEGPDIGGPHASYIQSERLDLYKKYANQLIEKGFAYPDPYTKEELEDFRKKAEEEKKPFLYRNHRPETFDIWDSIKPLRLKTPEIKSYSWNDAVRGELSAGPEALDDFILIKSDGYPTYNFAHIIDDLEMGVTHIMRADEFIASTPKFLSLYDALGITPPVIASLPPIMGEGGNKKLGKRDGAKDILEYRNEGYLPEAMMNFLALIGWNPGTTQEIFSKEELVDAFSLEKVQHAGGGFNQDKLDWLNHEHIKLMSPDARLAEIKKWLPASISALPDYREEKLVKLEPIITERIMRWGDIKTMADDGELSYFFTKPVIEKEKLIFKDSTPADAQACLQIISEKLSGLADWENTSIKAAVEEYANTLHKRGPALHPLRYALSGRDKSPDPFTIAAILGKDETLTRISFAVELLSR